MNSSNKNHNKQVEINVLVKSGGYAFVDYPHLFSADSSMDKLKGFNFKGSFFLRKMLLQHTEILTSYTTGLQTWNLQRLNVNQVH